VHCVGGDNKLGKLRGGVCKMGSGNDFLDISDLNDEQRHAAALNGVNLRPFGSKKK
jgi:hypothetical protein